MHLAPEPKPVHPELLFNGYVISRRAVACGVTLPGWSDRTVSSALASVREDIVRRSRLPGNDRADMYSVWMAAELDCLLGHQVKTYERPYLNALKRQQRAEGGVSGGEAGVFDIESTYAALRVRMLIDKGCSPGWWAGTFGWRELATTPPRAVGRAR